MPRPVQAFLLCLALLYVAFEAVATTAFDFRAFYCAGTVAAQGGNPYLAEPLHTCELRKTDGSYRAFARAVTLPAPLPGYDVALFVPFSRLPFAAAKAVWTLVLAAAAAASIAALVRLTGMRAMLVFACFWLSLIFPSLAYGELIPLSVAGTCIAALYAREHRWTYAALGALLSLVEPHLGVPVCLALAVWQPRTRVALGAGIAALAAISLAALGPAQNIEYFARVLPLHALSELGSDAQLSLSVVLHYAGVADAAAIRAGTIWYAAMALAAVYVSGAAVRRRQDAAYLVAIPAAFALIGGSFVHVTDMPAALPLALLSYRRIPQFRAPLAAAIVMLSLPWWHLALVLHQGLSAAVPMTAAVALYIAWELFDRNLLPALLCGALAAFALAGMNHWYVQSSDAYHRTARTITPDIDRRYPEASWGWTNARFISTGLPASWALRAPSWSGLLLVGAGALLLVRRSRVPGPRYVPESAGSTP